MANEIQSTTHSDNQEWEFIREIWGYKLCVSTKDENNWKYHLLNIAAVVSEGGFSSKVDAIKSATKKAKKLKKEKDQHFIEINNFFNKLR